jgi:hypothetical protein
MLGFGRRGLSGRKWTLWTRRRGRKESERGLEFLQDGQDLQDSGALDPFDRPRGGLVDCAGTMCAAGERRFASPSLFPDDSSALLT